MLSLFGANNCLPLFHMAKHFIWINKTKKRINDFEIGYMINPNLNINKSFREQVEKCMKLLLVQSHNLLLDPYCQKRKQ